MFDWFNKISGMDDGDDAIPQSDVYKHLEKMWNTEGPAKDPLVSVLYDLSIVARNGFDVVNNMTHKLMNDANSDNEQGMQGALWNIMESLYTTYGRLAMTLRAIGDDMAQLPMYNIKNELTTLGNFKYTIIEASEAIEDWLAEGMDVMRSEAFMQAYMSEDPQAQEEIISFGNDVIDAVDESMNFLIQIIQVVEGNMNVRQQEAQEAEVVQQYEEEMPWPEDDQPELDYGYDGLDPDK